jgi:hypothetical protein
MQMSRILTVLVVLFCAAVPCWAADNTVTVDGGWGLKPISYSAAMKRIHFHILLPQGWRPEDCVVYPNWILQEKSMTGNDPGPRLPSRQAVAVTKKGDPTHLILESPYLQGLSSYDNRQGMFWIVSAGYFTKALNHPHLGDFCLGRRGSTSYAILSSDPDKPNTNRFEQSLR